MLCAARRLNGLLPAKSPSTLPSFILNEAIKVAKSKRGRVTPSRDSVTPAHRDTLFSPASNPARQEIKREPVGPLPVAVTPLLLAAHSLLAPGAPHLDSEVWVHSRKARTAPTNSPIRPLSSPRKPRNHRNSNISNHIRTQHDPPMNYRRPSKIEVVETGFFLLINQPQKYEPNPFVLIIYGKTGEGGDTFEGFSPLPLPNTLPVSRHAKSRVEEERATTCVFSPQQPPSSSPRSSAVPTPSNPPAPPPQPP
jgi:hypothetical protein